MEEKGQIQGAQTTRILNGFLLERCQLFAQEASERGGCAVVSWAKALAFVAGRPVNNLASGKLIRNAAGSKL